MKLRDVSIRRKIPLIVMTTSAAALLLACTAFMVYDVVTTRSVLGEQVRTLALTYSEQLAPAVAFDQPKPAAEILATLKGVRHIVCAAVYDGAGREFARFVREGSPPGIVPSAPGAPGGRPAGGHLLYAEPIRQGTDPIGTLLIRSDMSPARERLHQGLRVTGGVLLLTLIAALLFAVKLSHVITKPVSDLARTVREVSEGGDYSLKAPAHGRDEVGQLIQGFNDMLAEIRDRDATLKKTHDELEKRRSELATYHDLVTHDVTNFAGTLMVILQHVLSRSEGELSEKQLTLLKRANRQIFQLNRLAENARTLVRLREKGLPDPGGRVALRALILRISETVQSVHFDRAARFDVDCPEDAAVAGIPLLESVLLNLLDNAVRHTPAGREAAVGVTVGREKGKITLSVRGGEEVEPELLGRIFDRYTRGADSRGQGLGLSVVREIVERAGGTVRAGTAKGPQGGVFEITLTLPEA